MHSERERQLDRSNTYERRPSPKCSQFEKQVTTESLFPQPPTDPEYATIGEWRRENLSQSSAAQQQQQPSVINTFYASSTVSLNKTNVTDPPAYLEVVESSFNNHQPHQVEKESVYNVNHDGLTHSLQDVRSCAHTGSRGGGGSGGNNGRTQNFPQHPLLLHQHSQEQQKLPPHHHHPAAAGRRAQTLHRDSGFSGSQSTHDLPRAATVRRHASMMTAATRTGLGGGGGQGVAKPSHGPATPPRPLLPVKRNASVRSLGAEPYLQCGQASPLVQSVRAGGGAAAALSDGVGAVGGSRGPGEGFGSRSDSNASEDDVGSDNYIIVPGAKQAGVKKFPATTR